MTEFFTMGGYGFYVWGAYLVTAIAVIAEILSVRSKRRATLAEARLVAPTVLSE
jgi:heme exporter protein D